MDKCPCCKKNYLLSEIERDCFICNKCADQEYERCVKKREFEYYHNMECSTFYHGADNE